MPNDNSDKSEPRDTKALQAEFAALAGGDLELPGFIDYTPYQVGAGFMLHMQLAGPAAPDDGGVSPTR